MAKGRSQRIRRLRRLSGCPLQGSGNNRLLRLEALESRRLLTVVFEDPFNEREFDVDNWALVAGASIDPVGINEPSAPYSARFNRHPSGGDVLESVALNLASHTSATVSYHFQRTGGGEPPEPDADLLLEYKDAVGDWIEVFRHLGDGPNMTEFQLEQVDLPAEALHAGFQFRFRLAGTDSLFDDWFVDDVVVTVGPGEIHGRKFNDLDRDGVFSEGDEPLANWTVYLDLNRNGLLEEGEPSRQTDEEGMYHFLGLSPDTYTVSEAQQAHWVPTLPSTPGAALVPVGSLVDGFDDETIGGAWSVAISPDDRFVYATLAGDDAVMVFSRDAVTGELDVLQSLRNGAGDVTGLDGARSVTLSPDGRHVYVAASNDDAVVAFARDEATGELAYLNTYFDETDGVDGLDGAWSVTVSADGLHVYVAASVDDAVAVFSRDADIGELAYVERITNGPLEIEECPEGEECEPPVVIVGLDGARGVVVSPDGAQVYVVSSNDNAVTVFGRDGETGLLTQLESHVNQLDGTAGLDGAFALTMSPDGRHVYASSVMDDALVVFSRDPLTGMLSFIDVERDNLDDVDGLDFAGDVIVAPDARHVYVVGADDDAIAIFERDEQSGQLTFSQSIVTGEADLFGVRGIVASGDGRHLYTASSLGSAVAAFRVPTVHVKRIISGQISEEMDFASFVTAPIWSGRGEVAFWSSPDNWLGRNPPIDDDELIFEGDMNTTNFNDLPPGLIARSIELVDGGFLITGNEIVLHAAGDTAILHREGTNRLRLPLTFQSPGKLRVDQGSLNLWGRLNIGPHTVVVQTHEGASNTLSGQIIGAGGLDKVGGGTLVLSGARGAENTYGGTTLIEAGTVQVVAWATLGNEATGTEVLPEATLLIATKGILRESVLLSGNLQLSAGTHFAGSVTVGADALLSAVDATTVQFSGTINVAKAGDGVTYESQHESSVLVLSGSNSYRGPTRFTGIGAIRLGASDAVPETSAVVIADDTTWQLAGFAASVGSLTGAGRIELDGATLTVGNDETSTEFAGTFTGSGELVKIGSGKLTLMTGLDHAGPTHVFTGQLEVPGSATAGPVITVHQGGSLTASGELARPLEIHDGGRLSPGPDVAELAAANLTLHAGSTLSLDVRGADHDRVVVTGGVSLAGAKLSLLMDAPPLSKRLLLIDNDGTDAVVGFFVDMPEGQLRVVGGVQFAITYTGGDGNDVELITIATISGLVFNDRNGDAVRGSTEEPMTGWTIYLDQNSNGQRDAGELTTETDSDGRFTFHDVSAGVARVTQVTSEVWTQTTPDREPFVLSYQQTQTNGGGIDGLDGAWSVAVSPDGRHVYAVSTIDSALTVLTRDVATGRLSFVESHFDNNAGVDGLAGAVSVTLSPDGRHVYAAGLFDSALAVFARNETTGRLAYIETKRDGADGIDGLADVLSVTLSPDGRHVYAAGNRDNALAVFSRDAEGGRLTFVEVIRDDQQQGTATIDGLAGAWHVTVSPDGRHVYATANLENALSVFARDEASGQLTYAERIKQGDAGVTSLDGASGVAVSPDGANVYVTADRDDTVTVFARDPETGHVTLMEVFRQGVGEADGINGANSIAISPDGGLVYVSGLAFDSLAAFTRDAPTGALTFLEVRSDNYQGVDGLDGVRTVTVSPDGRHIYTAASLDDAVTVFERDVPYFQFRVIHGQVVAGLEFGVKVDGPKVPDNGEVDPPPDDRGGIDVGSETSPRVVIEPAALSLIERGDALSYTVVLSAPPAANWTVTMVNDDAQLVLSTSRLVFTPHDWNVPRVVSVTAVDDGVVEGSHEATIAHRVTGDDPLRRPTAPPVVVNIADPAVVPGGVVGDTNRDGVVDLTDLNNVRNNFGRGGPGVEGDTNADGVVDLTDLNDVRNNFGATAAPSVRGDTNRDGVVDLTDLNNVRNNFGTAGPGVEGDTNGDGVVDLTDLNDVRNNFGARPFDSLTSVPPIGKGSGQRQVAVVASGDVKPIFVPGRQGNHTADHRVVTAPRRRELARRIAGTDDPALLDAALLAMLRDEIEPDYLPPI